MENALHSPQTLNLHFQYARRRSEIILVAVFLFALCSPVTAYRRERTIDTWRPLHYSVNLKFNDALGEIAEARTEIKAVALKPLSQIDLDFGDMTIDSITVNYQVARFEQRPGTIRIRLPEAQPRDSRFSIMVVYHGRPKDGLILTAD